MTLASCSVSQNAPEPQIPTAIASNSILCDFTTAIAGATIDLNCLIDPQQDPHTYTPKPSDRQALETAQLILYGGYGFEISLENLIETVDTQAPKVPVFEAAVTQPLQTEHHHHKTAETAADPHVWLDVENAIAIAKIIQNQLSTLNPDAAPTYQNQTTTLIADLERLDTWITAQIATIPPQQRVLVTTHDAFNYFAQAYNFQEAVALQGLSTEETPTAAQVKALVATIKTAQVPAVFSEIKANDRAIATVAREANVKVAQPPLLAGGLGNTASYADMMVTNTCAIVEGLGGDCQPLSRQ
ncbi:MAG: metal ABC transporter substrate-binding protein [Jaaginema sp. PMC 1079.18]|nr:metal ABC transporter substrate-binding protein [Jaaginema sp. PMC 1080.18]MEC4852913.1 metal ABC transporter substrate-binding protein [Jaaginema sp. PMC 1079.18]MEC4868790.1 metal ABC transporter substrate-binding protein [Jaaginema sp. PMC 1078.18]